MLLLPSWSNGFPTWEPVIDGAAKQNWNVLAYKGRGNDSLNGIGSDIEIQDIIDDINFVKTLGIVDTTRIYVLGLSGGGIWL